MKITAIDINGTPHVYGEFRTVVVDKLVAKSIGDERYLVLASKDGELFNPLDRTADINEKDKQRGGQLYNLGTCNQACFEHYCAFLRSKNRTSFILAQRSFV